MWRENFLQHFTMSECHTWNQSAIEIHLPSSFSFTSANTVTAPTQTRCDRKNLIRHPVPFSEVLLRRSMYNEAPNLFLPGTPKQISFLERHLRILRASQSLTWSMCRKSCRVFGIVFPTQKLLKAGELPQKNRQVWQLNIIVPRHSTVREISI